jgi:hypothetical protein
MANTIQQVRKETITQKIVDSTPGGVTQYTVDLPPGVWEVTVFTTCTSGTGDVTMRIYCDEAQTIKAAAVNGMWGLNIRFGVPTRPTSTVGGDDGQTFTFIPADIENARPQFINIPFGFELEVTPNTLVNFELWVSATRYIGGSY